MTFSAVAIVAAHNEADIIDQVIRGLVDQGIDVYFLDDGSTDGTVAAVERHLRRGVRCIEHLSDTFRARPAKGFEWERILRRKAQLASELDATWFIHHDADEFRESPWPGLTLREAIQRVDSHGFNAIDFELFNFWPVRDGFRPGDDVRESLQFYAPAEPYDRVQIRCWKKTAAAIDLASSGGHEVRFAGRKVCPLPFILRHYPIRSQAHGERKVQERRSRFVADERARGWHIQYDKAPANGSFIRDRSTLRLYDAGAVREALPLGNRLLENLERMLDDVRAEVGTLTRDLQVRTSELERSARDFERCSRDLDVRNRELEVRSRDLDTRNRELDARNKELDAQGRLLDSTTQDRDARVRELTGLYQQLGAQANDIAALRQQVDELQRTVTARTAEIEGLRGAVADSVRRLNDLHASLSWRVTAPARAVLSAFTKEGKR